MFRPETLIERFGDVDVLVVGDALLDGWLAGSSSRLCREAPVPVVTVDRRTYAPGGAANTAANVAALDGRVQFASVVGDDAEGRRLRAELTARGVGVDAVVEVAGRGTPAKRRLVADRQMIARLDDPPAGPAPALAREALLAAVDGLARRSGLVLVCDYGLGVFCDEVRAGLARLRPGWTCPVVVDAHDPARWAALRPTAGTPNWDETLTLLGGPAPEPGADRAAYLTERQDRLLDRSGAGMVVSTLDHDGALLLQPGRPPYRTYAPHAEPGRTTGAGDSFVAAFALALAAGANETAAVEVGNAAAGVVVRQPGTAVCTAPALLEAAARAGRDVITTPELAAYVAAHRAAGRRLVFTNGCFDMLHRGHVSYLNQAKELGDVLVVGINSDASVARLKGPDRPVNPAEDRAAVLAALSCVDHVVVFDADSPTELLELVRPDVYVKGGDYTPQMLPETPVVERLGGEVRILGYVEDRSTSRIIERIRSGEGR